jgi:hypothetical protein
VTRRAKVLSIVKIRQQENLPTDDKAGHDIQTTLNYPSGTLGALCPLQLFFEVSLTQ